MCALCRVRAHGLCSLAAFSAVQQSSEIVGFGSPWQRAKESPNYALEASVVMCAVSMFAEASCCRSGFNLDSSLPASCSLAVCTSRSQLTAYSSAPPTKSAL